MLISSAHKTVHHDIYNLHHVLRAMLNPIKLYLRDILLLKVSNIFHHWAVVLLQETILLGTHIVPLVKFQSWGFTSHSTARFILGQIFRIATYGSRTVVPLETHKQLYFMLLPAYMLQQRYFMSKTIDIF